MQGLLIVTVDDGGLCIHVFIGPASIMAPLAGRPEGPSRKTERLPLWIHRDRLRLRSKSLAAEMLPII
jgi:hypothetical protein